MDGLVEWSVYAVNFVERGVFGSEVQQSRITRVLKNAPVSNYSVLSNETSATLSIFTARF